MKKFKSVVGTSKRLAEFRRKYDLLDDVEVSYYSESKAILSRGEGRVVIPLVAIWMLENVLKHKSYLDPQIKILQLDWFYSNLY